MGAPVRLRTWRGHETHPGEKRGVRRRWGKKERGGKVRERGAESEREEKGGPLGLGTRGLSHSDLDWLVFEGDFLPPGT